jgi:hypothetical protein
MKFSIIFSIIAIVFALMVGALCHPVTETKPVEISKVMEADDALPFLLSLFKSLKAQGAVIVNDISKVAAKP